MKGLFVIVFIAISASQVISQDCTPLRCTLPVKAGDCTDSIQQYYFDNNAKRCRTFIYTGCGGNVNRFRTQQLCENTCLKDCSTTTTKAPGTTTKRTTTTKAPGTTTKRTTTTKAPGTTTKSTTKAPGTTTKSTTKAPGTTTQRTTTKATTTKATTTKSPSGGST